MSSIATGKTLVIAEKPSVAGDIARALGGMTAVRGNKGIDYYEGEHYIISSAVGHLLEIWVPKRSSRWNLQNLPELPDEFGLEPIAAGVARLRILEKLYRSAKVREVVNACDAGREGELIFHNLMRYFQGDVVIAPEKGASSAKSSPKSPAKSPTKTPAKPRAIAKPVRRLWLNSMTASAIRAGFNQLRGADDMAALQNAAMCRAEADWLVGINSTCAMTALHSMGGSFALTTVGRVQTPTLAILVEREQQINAFIARDYWEVRARFAAAAGDYEGRWFNPKEKEERPERIFDESAMHNIVNECKDQSGIATEKKKPQSESPYPLFDLTALQRAGNTLFHLPARATLAAAQALYERHKMITYPRTDAKALPEDYPPTVIKTLTALSADEELGKFARHILDKKLVHTVGKRVFNNAKISDHFAIVPTGEPPKGVLKEAEKKIYGLILLRFLSIFYPPAKYEVTERQTAVGNHLFLTKGRILIDAGWRTVGAQMPKDAEILPIVNGEKVAVRVVESEQKRTTPPPRYNEATLLSAMEGAGKLVDDEELREAMRERGMGTPATRASIIEGLIRERYVVRDGRELLPMPKAQSLLRLLRALKVEDLTLPAMTGEWEHKLRRIEQSDFDHEKFMDEIRALVCRIVEAAKQCGEVENVAGDYAVLESKCPVCAGEVRESHRRFSCQKCEFFVWKVIAGREFSVAEIEILLVQKKTEELSGFRNKKGREFSAPVYLREEDGKWRTVFDFEQQNAAQNMSAEEIQQQESIGACPTCGAPVRMLPGAFVCENKNDDDKCTFSMGRRLLQREMQPAEIAMMIKDGKTGLLNGFISKRTGRSFAAHLIWNTAEKKLEFEFAPRKSPPPKTKAAEKTTAAKKPGKKTVKKAVKKAVKKTASQSA